MPNDRPASMKIGECGECLMHYYGRGAVLREACATIAIETGKSSERLLIEYLSAYHNAGHAEPDTEG